MVFSHKSNFFLRFTLDLILLGVSFYLAHSIANKGILLSKKDYLVLVSFCTIWFFSSKQTSLYKGYRSLNFSYELVTSLKCTASFFITTLVLLFIFFQDYLVPRMFVILFFALFASFLIAAKYLVRKIFYRVRAKGRNLRHIVVVGAGDVGLRFHETIVKNKHFGYNFIGFLDDTHKPELNGHYLGKIEQLDEILSKHHVDEVIMALPNYAMDRIEDTINICENHTVRTSIIPDYFKFVRNNFQVSHFGEFPIISFKRLPLDELHNRVFKWICDMFVSLFAVVLVFSWLFPLIAILIKLTSKGPVFFKQERWGINNKRFVCYKFRSMVVGSKDVDPSGKYQQAKKDDQRITKIGRFIRKTNIDELPQFLNVLNGDMSVVGPRPHPVPLNLQAKDSVEKYMQRHLVKPGITGWAQVSGYRGETKTPRAMQKRVQYDLWYIENWSIWLDFQIMLLTFWNMIKGDKNAF